MPLRWGLDSGLLETYTVTIERRSSLQPYLTRQQGRLTRMVLAGSQAAQPNLAQMLELARGRAFREDPAPPLATAPAGRIVALLPRPHTQFSVNAATPTNAPLIVPGGSTFEKDPMRAMLDWGDWPEQSVQVGDQWSRESTGALPSFVRRFRFASFEQTSRTGSVAKIEFTAEPNEARASGSYQVTRLDGTIRWGVRSERVMGFHGHAVFTRNTPGASERIELDVTVEPKSRTIVSAAEHNAAHDQIVQLAAAIRAYNADRFADAQGEVRRFLERWPTSRWRPLADFLAEQVTAEQASGALATSRPTTGPGAGVHETLAAMLGQWRSAIQQGDPDRMAQTREALERIVRVKRSEVAQLVESADASERALGCLGLAFAEAPADVAVLSGRTEDDSAAVREGAYWALAIRGSSLVGVDMLTRGLDDAIVPVRIRACEAVAACVRPDSPTAATLAEELAGRLTDENARVRVAAARAIAAIGGPEQVEPLRQAADSPANESVRPALRAALQDLKTRLEVARPLK